MRLLLLCRVLASIQAQVASKNLTQVVNKHSLTFLTRDAHFESISFRFKVYGLRFRLPIHFILLIPRLYLCLWIMVALCISFYVFDLFFPFFFCVCFLTNKQPMDCYTTFMVVQNQDVSQVCFSDFGTNLKVCVIIYKDCVKTIKMHLNLFISSFWYNSYRLHNNL